ncbi:hypothetical protein HF086_012029 [Spodoptera exigua]|uniref:Salivary secreted peptide n=1 Tax=Spodoptera exigua TaxID=7107 RepID=A0A922MJ57_SPOEX|nr:hypothetical protein HF086_012029 [Spodoptera exigua]
MRTFIIIAVISAFVVCYGDIINPSMEPMSLVYDDDDSSLDGKLLSSSEVNLRNQQWIIISDVTHQQLQAKYNMLEYNIKAHQVLRLTDS